MNPTQSRAGTILWWIGGIIVVVLSGLAAYMYSSREPAQDVTIEQPAVQTKTQATDTGSSKTSTTTAAAVTSADLAASVTDLGTSLSNLDSTLSDFSAVDTQETDPIL